MASSSSAKTSAAELIANQTAEAQGGKDEGSYFFSRLLPDGLEASKSSEELVRKYVIVEGIAVIMAATHLALLVMANTYPASSSSSSASAATFFGNTIGFSLLTELLIVFLLRRNLDVHGAALLLVFNINVSTLALCLHYGVVAELYIWLGWVPKILTMTHGGRSGLAGLLAVVLQGVACYYYSLPLAPDVLGGFDQAAEPLVLDQTARLLNVSAFLLCFGMTSAVHEYCRANELLRLQTTLERMTTANADLVKAAEAKSIFLATTSHELRTPLHGIMAMANCLLERSTQDEQSSEYKSLQTIADSGRHLIELLDKILDFEKLNSSEFALERTPFSVLCEAERVCDTFAATMENKNIKLTKSFTVESATRHLGDPLRFRQVLVNLLSNAIKFTPDGGRITVAISAAKRGLRVEVTDTGVGISPHTQAKLFKDFVQGDVSIGRKYGGTGLGLAISKRFISAMGGEIGCHSQENQGSTFWFLIPLKTVKHPLQIVVSLACEDAAPGSARRKRVLLVDDNAVNQKVCLRMLGALGFDAIVASNGHECLNVLLRSDPLFFDAILMDFHMPVLDGLSTTRMIRANEEHRCFRMPIIGLTAMAEEHASKLAHDAGMDDCLSKPFTRAQLASAIRRWTSDPGSA